MLINVVLTRYLVKRKEVKVKKLVGGNHDEPEPEKQEEEEVNGQYLPD